METFHEFAFMFGFMLFAAGFHFVRVRSAQASWREAALKLGLNYKGGGLFVRPHVYGVVQGVPVLARIEDRGSGKSRRPFTVVRADVGEDLPKGLRLQPESFSVAFTKLFGEQDIQVGDPTIDDALLIQGESPAEVVRLLRVPGVRGAMLRCFRHKGATEVVDGQVVISVSGIRASEVGTFIRDAIAGATVLARAARRELSGPEERRASTRTVHSGDNAAASDERLSGDVPDDSPLLAMMQPGPPPEVFPPMLETEPAGGGTEPPLSDAKESMESPEHTPQRSESPAPEAPEEARPVSASSGGLPSASEPFLAALEELAAGGMAASSRDQAIERIGAHPERLVLHVAEVQWTSGLFLSEGLRQGRTGVGTLGAEGPTVAVRFLAARNRELEASVSELVTVVGRVVGWDTLYRRVLIDEVDGSPS